MCLHLFRLDAPSEDLLLLLFANTFDFKRSTALILHLNVFEAILYNR